MVLAYQRITPLIKEKRIRENERNRYNPLRVDT